MEKQNLGPPDVTKISEIGDDPETSLALGAHGYGSKTPEKEQLRIMGQEIQTMLDARSNLLEGS